jgi:hypothetical protein
MSAFPSDILTPRLILRLMEREVIDCCLAGDLQHAERLLDTKIPGELLDESTALKYARAQLDADPEYQLWSIRGIISPAIRTMVGHVRFHSRPDPDYLHPSLARLSSSAITSSLNIDSAAMPPKQRALQWIGLRGHSASDASSCA